MPSARLSLLLVLLLSACGSVTPPATDAAPADAAPADAGPDGTPPIDAPSIDAPPELAPTHARQLSVLSGRVSGGGLVLEVEVSALPATPLTGGGNTLTRATPIAP